jgi:hypothetical protein
MPLVDLRESSEKQSALRRRSTIVQNIVAAAGATLGISAERKPSPDKPAIVDTIAAVVIATLALAVLLCVAALSPVVWTFAGDAASQLRGELSQCSSIEESRSRVTCYDEIAHRPPPHPAKGANALRSAFGRASNGETSR